MASKPNMKQVNTYLNQIEHIPFENFNSVHYVENLRRVATEFHQMGDEIFVQFEHIVNEFNLDKIKEKITNSKTKEEVAQKINPYIEDFERYFTQIFPNLVQFFEALETEELYLSGFKYRFMVDSIHILSKARECDMYLIDEDSKDMEKLDRDIRTFIKKIDAKIIKNHNLQLGVDQKIKNKLINRIKGGLLKKFRNKYNEFQRELQNEINSALSNVSVKSDVFHRFDSARTLILQDIQNNKIKLDFFKKLQEYFYSLSLFEATIYKLEENLLETLSSVFTIVNDFNSKIYTFLNYILNEEAFSEQLKDHFRQYIEQSAVIKQGLERSLSQETQIDANLKKAEQILKQAFFNFAHKHVKTNNDLTEDNAKDILQQRLNQQ